MNASIRLVRIALLAAPALLLTAGAPARGQGCTPFWATLPGVTDSPRSFVSFDDGSGPALYASFSPTGLIDTVARYRNGVWTTIDSSLPLNPWDPTWVRWTWLRVLDGGTGARLYILGYFQWYNPATFSFEEQSWGRVWDGSAWQPVDPNFVPADRSIWPAISGDIGNGQQIFGTVELVNTSSYQGVAVWTGSTWTHMGRSLSAVPAMTIGDLGAGPHLYIFGVGPSGTQNPFSFWNGTDWEQIPGNQISISTRAAGGGLPAVHDQCSVIFNDGTGPAIYVSGQIRLQSDPNHDIPGLGRWDGHTWTNCGGPNLGPNTIYARGPLTVFDDGTGSGPALYTTGGFSDYGGVPANGIARYSAGQWSGVGWGVLPGDDFRQLVVGRDSRGPSLFISGDDILHAGGAGVPAHNLVQLVGCPNCYANCDQSTASPALNIADFTCFLQKFAAPDPSANCDMSMTPPNLNVADFTCFLRKFAQGCP